MGTSLGAFVRSLSHTVDYNTDVPVTVIEEERRSGFTKQVQFILLHDVCRGQGQTWGKACEQTRIHTRCTKPKTGKTQDTHFLFLGYALAERLV